jgi:hypothetical protein
LFEVKATKTKQNKKPCWFLHFQVTFSFQDTFVVLVQNEFSNARRRKYSNLKIDFGLAKMNRNVAGDLFTQVQGCQMNLVRTETTRRKSVFVLLQN